MTGFGVRLGGNQPSLRRRGLPARTRRRHHTNWNSHEPASLLHHLVFLPDSYDAMRFLIDRGIDLTIKDYRWNSPAEGWARYRKADETLADWLAKSSMIDEG
jgi:hypothetical protein